MTRPEWEAKIAEALGRMNERMLRELLRVVGSPPDPRNIPASFWTQYGDDLRTLLEPLLRQLYLDQARVLGAQVEKAGIDWSLPNEAAARWAKDYTFELVKGVVDTTTGLVNDNLQALLRDAIAGGFADSLTNAQIAERLMPAFGASRAEMIAVTETTRAAAAGETAIVDQLRANGIRMVATWNTSEDELVCPICEPLDGVPEKAGGGWTNPVTGEPIDSMPAHPYCRCFKTHTFVGGDA